MGEVERKLFIIEEATEDIAFGIVTLRALDLLQLMFEGKKDVEIDSEVNPENAFVEHK